jgi:hypothetical protein
MAECKLQTTYYSGESKRFDFEKFTKMHVDQHYILENLVCHGYSGVNDHSKVCYLMDGIKSNKLEPITTCIMSDNKLLEDFPRCVTLYKQYVQKLKGKKGQPLNISATALQPAKKVKQPFKGKGNTKCQGTGGNAGKIKDQFYTPEEYCNLTPDQRNDLRKLRASCRKKQKTGVDNHVWSVVLSVLDAQREAAAQPQPQQATEVVDNCTNRARTHQPPT